MAAPEISSAVETKRPAPALTAVLDQLRQLQPELKRRYPIKAMGIFGSYVRGEQTPASDLDVLVEFDASIGLLDVIRLQQDLGERLGVKVDLVMKGAPKPRVRRRIEAEVVML